MSLNFRLRATNKVTIGNWPLLTDLSLQLGNIVINRQIVTRDTVLTKGFCSHVVGESHVQI